MAFSSRLVPAAIVAATLLLPACDDLQPSRRRPPVAVAVSDTARPKPSGTRRDSARETITGPEVEAVLLQHPSVKEVLVIGMPDPYRGECPRAYAVLVDGATEDGETLKGWLNARLGKHERVDAVVLRSSLPKTMVGKLDRKALRAEVGAFAPATQQA